MVARPVLLVFLLLLGTATSAAEVASLVTVDDHAFADWRRDRQQTMRRSSKLLPMLGTGGAGWLRWAEDRSIDSGLALRGRATICGFAADPPLQTRPAFRSVRSGSVVDPAWRARVSGVLDVGLGGGWIGHFRFAFDSEGQNDPRNRTRDFSQLGASNNVDQAYVSWRGRRVAVNLGRFPLDWGPEQLGPLVLSSTAPALDLAHVNLRWHAHHLQTFVAELSSEADADGRVLKRFLYGHRADLFLTDRWRVGLSETALVSGAGEGISLQYLNPFQLLVQTQVEDDGDDATRVNAFTGIDTEVLLGPVRAYGSLLVDDFQIDREGRDRNPHQLAWAAGFDLVPSPQWPWWVTVEARRAGSWTYLHRGPGADYRHFGRPLGAPEGPDTETLHAGVRRELGEWLAGIDVARGRRGENRLDTEETREGHSGEPFPRGVAEKRWTTSVSAERRVGDFVRARAEIAATWFTSLNHAAADESVWEFRLAVDAVTPRWTANWSDASSAPR